MYMLDILTLDMLFSDTCLYHLTTDVLSPDMLFLTPAPVMLSLITYPLLLHDLSLVIVMLKPDTCYN